MWRIKRITHSSLLALLLIVGCTGYESVRADTTAVPSLTISQLKVTSSNGQFVTLYNSSNSTLNMSNYQLEYFNSFDLSKATSSKLIALAGTLPPHSYFMVNDGTLQLCYQLTVNSATLGFSTTSGFVEVLGMNQAAPGGLVSSSLQDYVGWSKTAATGAQTLPASNSAFLQRQPVDVQNNPAITTPGSGTWQPVQTDPANSCGLVSATNTTTPISNGLSQLLPATEPPVTIVSVELVGTTPAPSMPASDIGLMAPQITELLPNPIGTGNDATDEYIELYNANDVPFDLTGFGLQSGLTTLHTYSLPAGTSLAPHSFTVFQADTTKLTLSNSGGQVKLLDPFDNAVAASDVYGAAADGQAWGLANGKWYWTTQPTPGAANIIKQPPVKASKAASTASKSKASSSAKTATTKKLQTAHTASSSSPDSAESRVPIHPWELALVAAVALLYGLYEYRKDLANYLRQSRAKLSFGGFAWAKVAWWRGDRASE